MKLRSILGATLSNLKKSAIPTVTVVSMLLLSGSGAATEYYLSGGIVNGDDVPLQGEELTITNPNNAQYTTATSGQDGSFSQGVGGIGVAPGQPVRLSKPTLIPYCTLLGVAPVTTEETIVFAENHYHQWVVDNGVYGPDYTVYLGTSSEVNNDDDTIEHNNGLRHDTAERDGNDEFSVSAAFSYEDYDDDSAEDRWYNFELIVTYLGYTDTNCDYNDDTDEYYDTERYDDGDGISYGPGDIPYHSGNQRLTAANLDATIGIGAGGVYSISILVEAHIYVSGCDSPCTRNQAVPVDGLDQWISVTTAVYF